MEPLVLAGVSLVLGLILGVLALWFVSKPFRRKKEGRPAEIHAEFVIQRVRAVGRLVGLEVSAKEIATSTRGFGWLPPLILSQARVAMIFRFEKQYSVDFGRLAKDSVSEIGDDRFTITLPKPEGRLRLLDVTPYDIQAGKVLGLLDVLPVGAATQKELMARAQEQAADLYEQADERYEAEAIHSIERQLESLLSMFGVTVEVRWEGASSDEPAPVDVAGV